MTEKYEDGALPAGNGMTLPYLWVSLHLNARMVQDLLDKPRFERETVRFERETKEMLAALSDVDADRWLTFCNASGMTAFGIVGLSWCRDVTSDMFWSAWDATTYDLQPNDESERPFKYINPQVLPKAKRVTEIVAFCGNDARRTCLVFAAMVDPVEIDLTKSQVMQTQPDILRAFLLARQEQSLATSA